MYEFKDGDGELVTVRSLRTLERLIADAAIRPDTPFRTGGETAFMPASTHWFVGPILAEINAPLAESSTTVPAKRVPSTASSEPSFGPEHKIPAVAVPVTKEARPVQRLFPPAPDSRAASPWRLPRSAPPPKRQAPSPQVASGGTTFLTALAWQGGALLAGLLAFRIGSTALHSWFGVVAALPAVLLTAYAGGKRLRHGRLAAKAAAVWAAAVSFVCLLALIGGPGGILMALAAAAGLIFGWRKGTTWRA